MERKGSPLLSRDVAKIVIGSKNIYVDDINEKIQANQNDPRFAGKTHFSELDSATLSAVQKELSSQFDSLWQVAEITDRITGRPTQWLSRFYFDPFLADRERQQITREHPDCTFVDFLHNMAARVIKREMDVGMLIFAPNRADGCAQQYVLTGKLATGQGMVSYIFHPAGIDSTLEPIRLFRGTSPRNSDLDALSTMITDCEADIGRSAYESGQVFEPIIAQRLGLPRIEVGHSMGSTVVQHRLAHSDHIQQAYLFCGPGVSAAEAEEFNRRNPHVRLVIRLANNDFLSNLGEVHVGYQAPANVQVDFLRYRPRGRHNHDPHVSVWGRMPDHFEVESGITPAIRDQALDHRGLTCELYRSFVGPFVSVLLGWVRDVVRFIFSSRIAIEKGLKIGYMAGSRWQVAHFRAV